MNELHFARRRALKTLLAAGAAGSLMACGVRSREPSVDDDEIAALERACGGRLGVFAIDTGSGAVMQHRADERFGLCSTFKLPLAAVVLREADAGRLALDEVLRFGPDDMVPHAPVTTRHLKDGGMTIAALAEAGQTTSDNVAANLLIDRLGGPAAVTQRFRAMGDDVTRIDRKEPGMNFVPAGEVRDTTTPRAIATCVTSMFRGELLTAESMTRLRNWMIATKTGLRRLRAGLPAEWIAGDKTGTGYAPGMPNKHNDVAIAWPPRRSPIVIAAYLDAAGEFPSARAEDDAVLAQVGGVVARHFG